MAFRCCAALHEFERGLAYFRRKDVFPDSDLKFNVMLAHLFDFQQKELFIKEYDKALKQGIEPEHKVTQAYNTLQETADFPDHL